MKQFNFIFLRSAIEANKDILDAQREEYLSKLALNNEIKVSNDGEPIFFIESGGSEELFKKIYKEYKEPYVLFATNANNSLPASLEIISFLDKHNLKNKLIHSTSENFVRTLEHIEIPNEKNFRKITNEVEVLKGKRAGVVGRPSNWLISSDVDYSKAKEKFGLELVDISFEEFKREIDKKILPSWSDNFIKENQNDKINSKEIELALYIYSALKNLVIKYKLDAFTVRCFDLLGTVKSTSCLAFALLAKEGIVATCEGDIPALITMMIIKARFGLDSFQANPSYINLEKNEIILAHCTIPLSMVTSYKLDTHFESKIGIGIKGELETKGVTIFKVNSSLDKYCVLSAKIEKNLSKDNLCRTQILLKTVENLSEILTSPNGNHLIIFYGDHKQELVNLLEK